MNLHFAHRVRGIARELPRILVHLKHLRQHSFQTVFFGDHLLGRATERTKLVRVLKHANGFLRELFGLEEIRQEAVLAVADHFFHG